MTISVHQLVPTISPRDAVGNHTLFIRSLLRAAGYDSDIFSMFRHPELTGETFYIDQLPADADALVYQFSIGSPIADRWAQHGGRKFINYHNITPVEFIGKWDGLLEAEVEMGRDQMSRLASICEHAICDSDFNRSELDSLGYNSTTTIPVLFDVASANPDASTLKSINKKKSGLQILFVGRIAPNKAHHDLIAAVRTFRDVYQNDAHLHIVGTDGPPNYRKMVDAVVAHADMADHVTFHGSVTQEQLVAFYQGTDIFLCVSDHEGFCVPVVEAMHHQLPVIAYNSTAVGETVGQGGLLLNDKHPLTIAAALNKLNEDGNLAGRLRRAGVKRAACFNRETTSNQFTKEFVDLMGSP